MMLGLANGDIAMDIRAGIRVAAFAKRHLASIVVAGLWVAIAAPAHAGTICAGSGCATSASVTGESARETSVSKPVTLNRYAKRTAKKKSALRTRVAAKRNVRVSKAAQYARVAARVKKAGKKFTVAAAKPASSESAPLKPSLANARAEMTADAGVRVAGAANDSPIAVEAKAPETNIQLVAADQVNEIDRAAENETKPQPTVKPAPVPLDARSAVVSSDSTWDQTSLIGKLFVAFGGLLTLASAARLFIA